MGWGDDILLAMVPLGILTCVVSAIRIGGRKWLKALVGRARESKATAELELLSSTSDAVCELWSGDEIVRERGNPHTKEFIYRRLDTNNKDRNASEIVFDLDTAYTSGILRLKQYGMHSLKVASKLPQGKIAELADQAPNLTLNVTKAVSTKSETWFFASIGVLVQLAVWVSSGFSTYHWKLHSGRAFESYGYPMFLAGSILLSVGIMLCSHIIEASTDEVDFEPNNPSDNLKIIRIQRTCTVGEQHYGSFVVENNENEGTIIRTSRINLERDFSALALIAASLSIGGYIIQFIGLRALHWSTAVAVLGATFIMTGVRSYVRRGLSAAPNPKPIDLRECEDQELSWIALDAAQLKGWELLLGTYGDGTRDVNQYVAIARQDTDHAKDYLTTKVVEVREQTERLVSWNGNISVLANQLADAIHATLELLLGEDNLTLDEGDVPTYIYKWNDPDEPSTREPSIRSSYYYYSSYVSTRSSGDDRVVKEEANANPVRDSDRMSELPPSHDADALSTSQPDTASKTSEVAEGKVKSTDKTSSMDNGPASEASEVVEEKSKAHSQAASLGDSHASEVFSGGDSDNGSHAFNLYLSEIALEKDLSSLRHGDNRAVSHIWPTPGEINAALQKRQCLYPAGLSIHKMLYGGEPFGLGLSFGWNCPVLLQASDESLSEAVKSPGNYRLHTQFMVGPFDDLDAVANSRVRRNRGRGNARQMFESAASSKSDRWSLSVTTLTAVLSLSIYTIQSKVGKRKPGARYIRLIGDRENPLLEQRRSDKAKILPVQFSASARKRASRRRTQAETSKRKVEEWKVESNEGVRKYRRTNVGHEDGNNVAPREVDALDARLSDASDFEDETGDQVPEYGMGDSGVHGPSPDSNNNPRVDERGEVQGGSVEQCLRIEPEIKPQESTKNADFSGDRLVPEGGEASSSRAVDTKEMVEADDEAAELSKNSDLQDGELKQTRNAFDQPDGPLRPTAASMSDIPTVHAVWIERTMSALVVPFPKSDQTTTLIDWAQNIGSEQPRGELDLYPVFGYAVASTSRTLRDEALEGSLPRAVSDDDKRRPGSRTSTTPMKSSKTPEDLVAISAPAPDARPPARRISTLSGLAKASHRSRLGPRETVFRREELGSRHLFEAVTTSQPLSLLCAQEIFSSFLLELTQMVPKVGGQTFKRPAPNSHAGDDFPRLDNTIFTKIADILMEFGLAANQEEAYTLIIPPFHARGLLPRGVSRPTPPGRRRPDYV